MHTVRESNFESMFRVSARPNSTSFLPPIINQPYHHQEQLVPQIFEEDSVVVVQMPPPVPSVPSTAGRQPLGFQQYPFYPIHGTGNYNHVQHLHHPRNCIGVPMLEIWNHIGPPGYHQVVGSALQVPMFLQNRAVVPLHQSHGGFGYGPAGIANHHRHFPPRNLNSHQIHGENNSSSNVRVPPRHLHDHRQMNHNPRTPQNFPAEHHRHVPPFQNTSSAPRIRRSSTSHVVRVLSSEASLEIIDEHIIIDLFPLARGDDTHHHHTDHHQEDTNNAGSGLPEDFILRNLKTSTLVRKQQALPDEICIICQDEFQENNRVGTLHCGHVYHVDCITKWLTINNQCPLCKRTGLEQGTGADS